MSRAATALRRPDSVRSLIVVPFQRLAVNVPRPPIYGAGVLVAASVLAVAAGGCGAIRVATHSRSGAIDGVVLQVSSSSCSTGAFSGASPGSSPSAQVSSSCTFVLSDGRRFGCPARFGRGPTATDVGLIEHAKACVPLARLVISPGLRAVGARIGRARACLAAHGLKAAGGVVLPPQGHGPAGELDNAAAEIAFYTDRGQASRAEPAIVTNVKRIGGQFERAGSANIAWYTPPSRQLRAIVKACAAR